MIQASLLETGLVKVNGNQEAHAKKGIDDLNELGRTLLEQSLSNVSHDRPIVPPK